MHKRPLYKDLPVTLRREFYECFGVTPRTWLFQPAAGYTCWFMLNAWEMAKLRTYYLHGPFDDGVEVWEAMMQDWCRGPHPVPVRRPLCYRIVARSRRRPNSVQLCMFMRGPVDVFVQFLSVVPGNEEDDALTCAMEYMFNPAMALTCLQLGLCLRVRVWKACRGPTGSLVPSRSPRVGRRCKHCRGPGP